MILLSIATAAGTPGLLNLDLFKWVVGALLSSGLITGFLTYKIQRGKAPAETDSIVVQGAENAVLAIQKVLDSEISAHNRTREDRDRLQREVDEQRDEIRELLAQIDVLQSTVAALKRRVMAAAERVGVDTDPDLRAIGGGQSRGI